MRTVKANFYLDEYLSAALEFGISRKAKDFRAGNRYADILAKLGPQMRTMADGQAYLLSLLANDDPYVRAWAAKDCLFFAPEKAVPMLESLCQVDGLSLSASTTLDEWRQGRLN